MSLELNGKSLKSMQDFKMFWNNIRSQTEHSTQYIDKHGAYSFLFPDTAQSVSYSSGLNSLDGDRYVNTAAFSSAFGVSAPPGGATVQNDGLRKRLQSNPPTIGADFRSSWPAFGAAASSTTIASQLARGGFTVGVATTNSMMGTWDFVLKVRLADIHPIFAELDLMANPQIRLRFKVNQGSADVAVSAVKGMSVSSITLRSGNSCPVIVSSASTGNPIAGVLAASAGFSVH
jgi:hypothetical protein